MGTVILVMKVIGVSNLSYMLFLKHLLTLIGSPDFNGSHEFVNKIRKQGALSAGDAK